MSLWENDLNNSARMENSRRRFIKHSLWGATACWTIPSFLDNTLHGLDARASSARPAGADGPILVVVQLAGGNDSLNTVIPYTNATYLSARPNLNITQGVLPLGNTDMLGQVAPQTVALHPGLGRFHELWEGGDLAIVNGVGYPNPNLSHFTSFDYWHTAEPHNPIRDGWLGRFFDHQCSGCDPTSAFNMDNRAALAFLSSQGTSANVDAKVPAEIAWKDFSSTRGNIDLENSYRHLIGLDHPLDSGVSDQDEVLAYVQRSSHNAMISARTIYNVLDSQGDGFPYSNSWAEDPSKLEKDFKNVAALIAGGLDTSIYYMHQGGYDTHNNQISADPDNNRHDNLLAELNTAIGAFADEMKAQGVWDRVLLFTFSEFGRKVIENGSNGTDHGAAASLFAMGGAVNPGFYGLFPDLDDREKKDSLKYNVDFRRVYRTALQNWLGLPASALSEVFPNQPSEFSPLGFI